MKFWRVLKRSIVRACTREIIGDGNVETRRQFFSLEALCWEHISQRKRFVKQSGLNLPFVPSDVPVVLIESAKDLNEFYRLHGLNR